MKRLDDIERRLNDSEALRQAFVGISLDDALWLATVARAAEQLTEAAELIENPPTTEAGRAFDILRAALNRTL